MGTQKYVENMLNKNETWQTILAYKISKAHFMETIRASKKKEIRRIDLKKCLFRSDHQKMQNITNTSWRNVKQCYPILDAVHFFDRWTGAKFY